MAHVWPHTHTMHTQVLSTAERALTGLLASGILPRGPFHTDVESISIKSDLSTGIVKDTLKRTSKAQGKKKKKKFANGIAQNSKALS